MWLLNRMLRPPPVPRWMPSMLNRSGAPWRLVSKPFSRIHASTHSAALRSWYLMSPTPRLGGGSPSRWGIEASMSLALRGECDVIVVASADTDLRPAIEEARIRTRVKVEVAAWWGERTRQRLSLRPNVWCHWLRLQDYEAVRDDTDYSVRRA